MNPQERDLIQSVFDRLARAGVGAKDAEAEAMINERLCHQPDAAYGLVQAVIMQEMGLNQATQTINALQRQLEEARNAAGPQPTGSFLGGNGPWAAGSVPRVGQPMPPPPQAAPSPWSQQAAPSAPWSQPAAAPAPAANWGQPSAAGGFLRNAATMAAGVAGGALIAEGISSLFGGHHGYGGGFGGGMAGGSPWGGAPGGMVENVTVNNYYGDSSDDSDSRDSGYQDTAADDSFSSDSGFDDSSDA